MSGPDVSVIIPNLNGGSMLIDALRSASGEAIERIVVDNGSSDGSPDAAERLGDNVRVLRAGRNLGVAEACDRGATEARGEFLLFLNNDARLDANALERLLAEARRDKRTAVWQPIVVGRDGNIESAGGLMTHLGFMWTLREPMCSERSYPVFSAIGPCVLARRAVYSHLGGFDAAMFAYFEEVDFCWRARVAGFDVRVVPSALVHHLGGVTTARTLRAEHIYYLGYRNRLRSMLTNGSLRTLLGLAPAHLVACLSIAAGFVVNGRLRPAGAILRAVVWPIGNHTVIRERRRAVARLRLSADAQVMRPELTIRLTPSRAIQLFRGNLRRW